MNASRREVLKMSGLASATLVGVSNPVASKDADPRPEPVEGTQPNANVPTTRVGTVPGQNGTVSTGNWIEHGNGWVTKSEFDDACNLREFLDATTQVFTIAGEEFVLDGFADWDFTDPHPDPDTFCSADFSYTTPPKPPGTTYEMTWEVLGDESEWPVIDAFPFSNEIRVVKGRGKK